MANQAPLQKWIHIVGQIDSDWGFSFKEMLKVSDAI